MIDGTHMPILCSPEESSSEYLNQKGFYSFILQTVVDYSGIFLDIYLHMCVGWVKSMMLMFFRLITLCKGTRRNIRTLGGINVPRCILGDPACPALLWLMKTNHEHHLMT